MKTVGKKIFFFVSAVFLYTIVTSTLIRDVGDRFDSRGHMMMYMVHGICVFAGLYLFPLLTGRAGIPFRIIRGIMVAFFILFSVCFISIDMTDSSGLAVVLAMTAAVCMGFAVGMSYVVMSEGMNGDKYIGRIVGGSCGLVIVIQYILQIRLDPGLPLSILTCMAYAYIIVIRIRANDGPVFGERTETPADTSGQERTAGQKHFPAAALIAACFITLALYFDEQLTIRFSTADFFSWPRLMYAVGYFGMGVIWDIKKVRIAPIAMLTAAVSAFLLPILLTDPGFYTADMCLFYLYVGTTVSYNSLNLMSIADRYGNGYAAVSYRALDNILTSVFILINIGRAPYLVIIVIDIVMLVLAILLMWLNGDLHPIVYPEVTRDEGGMEAFAVRYGLTDRESEVLELLLTSDEKGDDMAHRLGISRRGFVSFTSSIYKKTGTSSRISLMQKYMNDQDTSP